jgi:hypothetical protein
MVVSAMGYTQIESQTDTYLGHSRELSCHARGSGKNRRWKRAERRRLDDDTLRIYRNPYDFKSKERPKTKVMLGRRGGLALIRDTMKCYIMHEKAPKIGHERYMI